MKDICNSVLIQYRQFLESRNSTLKYVILTHLHADFVAGHLDLANKTGATIVLGPQAVTKYEAKVAQDEGKYQYQNLELLTLGKV